MIEHYDGNGGGTIIVYVAIIIAIIIFANVCGVAYYFAGVKGIVGMFAIIALALGALKIRTDCQRQISMAKAEVWQEATQVQEQNIKFAVEQSQRKAAAPTPISAAPTPISATVVADTRIPT